MSTEKFSVANEIVAARLVRGLTQAALAKASGVSLSAIKGYEAGRNAPGGREIRALCQALQLSPNRLIFGSETPFPEWNLHDSARALLAIAGLIAAAGRPPATPK